MLTRAEAKEKICISKKETYPYSIEDNVDEVIDQIYNDHEAQLKQAYIDGSNSTNELIQSLYKQIEQLKDNQ